MTLAARGAAMVVAGAADALCPIVVKPVPTGMVVAGTADTLCPMVVVPVPIT